MDRRRRRDALELTTTGLLVVYAKCVRPAEEAAWDAWEDDVHLPALCAGDGPWAATRFELTARPQPGMPGVRASPTSPSTSSTPTTPVRRRRARSIVDDALRAAGRVHPAHATMRGRRVRRPRPLRRPSRPPTSSRRGHILTHVLCTDPAREAEWDRVVRRAARARHAVVRRVLGHVAVASGARPAPGGTEPPHALRRRHRHRRRGGATFGGDPRRRRRRRAQASTRTPGG